MDKHDPLTSRASLGSKNCFLFRRYGSQSYEHKPSYRHRRSIDGLDTFVNAVSDGVSTTIQAHADGKKAKVDFIKGLFSKRSVEPERDGRVVLVREGQRFFLLERPESVEGGREAQQLVPLLALDLTAQCLAHFSDCERVAADASSAITIGGAISSLFG